jgi:hypothetical protein
MKRNDSDKVFRNGRVHLERRIFSILDVAIRLTDGSATARVYIAGNEIPYKTSGYAGKNQVWRNYRKNGKKINKNG